MSEVAITPMTGEHVEGAVAVHMEAFAGYMNAALGRRYVRAFLHFFARSAERIALVAVRDGVVVGYVVGARLDYTRAMTRELLPVVALSFALRPGLLLQRRFLRVLGTRLKQLFAPAAPAASAAPIDLTSMVSLVGIGVSSRARGTGVGRLLAAAFERHARQLGVRAMRLTVYRENAGARRLYEAAGWSLTSAEDAPVLSYERALR